MRSAIIKSEAPLKRSPGLAFIFSFIATGLGQIYSGNFLKGLVFFICRLLAFLIIPAYAIIRKDDFSVIFFLSALTVNLLVWLVSCMDAVISATGKKSYNLRGYNNIIIYFLYTVITSALIFVSGYLITLLFTVMPAGNDDMYPGFLKNDYILINKSSDNASLGDVVTFVKEEKTALGRITAQEGEIITVDGNSFMLTDAPLPHGVLTGDELIKLGLKNEENLFFEINGGRKYPVIIKGKIPEENKKNKKKKNKPVTEILGDYELLIAYDNRNEKFAYDIIKKENITGIAAGIIYNKDIKRILNKLYLTAE